MIQNSQRISAVVIAVFLACICVAPNKAQQKASSRPYVMRMSLAGERLNLFKPFGGVKYDPNENYYLLGDISGPDHVYAVSLRLIPNTKEFDQEWGYKDGRKVTILPRLRSGKGVNIGDTPAQVRRKMGKRPKKDTYRKDRLNRKIDVRVWEYIEPIYVIPPPNRKTRKKERWTYHASYIFRRNHLWSIEYGIVDPTWRY